MPRHSVPGRHPDASGLATARDAKGVSRVGPEHFVGRPTRPTDAVEANDVVKPAEPEIAGSVVHDLPYVIRPETVPLTVGLPVRRGWMACEARNEGSDQDDSCLQRGTH